MGANLLQEPGIELLSDDSPLIDHRGRVYAFPLRLGLLPGSAGALPEKELRRVERMELGPNMLASYRYFKDRIRPQADGSVLFLGSRSLGSGMHRSKGVLPFRLLGHGQQLHCRDGIVSGYGICFSA